MSSVSIRDACLPDDLPQLLAYIMGSQRFEHVFEPNRRLDEPVAAEYFKLLAEIVRCRGGKIFVAEGGSEQLLGWGVVHADTDDVYVIGGERTFAYISELFVVEESRGKGVGRALIGACEDWARLRGLAVMQIGVLPGNRRAAAIYDLAGYKSYGIRLRKYLSPR